jgi:hypothetical protein
LVPLHGLRANDAKGGAPGDYGRDDRGGETRGVEMLPLPKADFDGCRWAEWRGLQSGGSGGMRVIKNIYRCGARSAHPPVANKLALMFNGKTSDERGASSTPAANKLALMFNGKTSDVAVRVPRILLSRGKPALMFLGLVFLSAFLTSCAICEDWRDVKARLNDDIRIHEKNKTKG